MVLPTFHSNLTTTVNLLISATEIGIKRFILAGSLEEPEAGGGVIVPPSPYAASKWAASAYARMFHEIYNTSLVNLRIFMTYGPGNQSPQKLIPYVINSLLNQEAPKLSNGQRKIDWIFIDDLIDGMIRVAFADDVDGCTIDLGSGKGISIQDIVEKLVSLVNQEIKPIYGAIDDRPMEQVNVANIDDTYKKIGWKPKISLDRGLESTVRWFKAQQ